MAPRKPGKVCFSITGALLFLASLLFPGASNGGETVVATVNGEAITIAEVEETIDQLLPRGIFHGKVSDDQRGDFREKALETLITGKLQHQDALARGLKPDRKQVKEQMRATRESFPSKWEYEVWLQRKGLNEDRLRKLIERALVVRTAIARIAEEPAVVNEEKLQEHYAANTDKFQEPASVRLRIISMAGEKNAAKALEAVKAGEDFASVAARLSEDEFRQKGGDLGQVRKGMIFTELEAVAFGMRKGEVSAPVFSEGKWFVLKVDDAQPARTLTFPEVREKLKRELEQKKTAELLEQWVDGLRAKAVIVLVSAPTASR